MKLLKHLSLSILVIALCFSGGSSQITEVEGPGKSGVNRSRGLQMLKKIRNTLKLRYFDKELRGIDIDAKYNEARDRIKSMDTNSQIFSVIAQFVLLFDDSHTRFYPPGRANRVEYGFKTQMIGNICYVVDVTKGSDAEEKGLKVGDVVTGLHRFNPNRENLWKINYLIYQLQPLVKIDVYLLDSEKNERKLEIEATFKSIEQRRKERSSLRKKEKERGLYRCHEVNIELIACRLETFVVRKETINEMMREIKGHKRLVLDLRGNGGGYVYIEEYLVGHFFDRDVKIADFKTRKKTKARIAKSHKGNRFDGEFIVLIDSESGSAAEVFARVIQLEKRGRIFGDVSAGAVMTSIFVQDAIVRGPSSLMSFSVFGLSVTVADLIMSDGKRLENVGVIPDLPIGPTGIALANRTDPVLAYAIGEFGGEMSEKETGDLHFLMPKTEGDAEDASDEAEPESGIKRLMIDD